MEYMKALQVVKPRSFSLVQVPIPDLKTAGRDYILVRPSWVSLCGSDIPFFTGSNRSNVYPLLPGAPIHECVGQVIESTSESFQPGDIVIAIPETNQGLAEYFIARSANAIHLPVDRNNCDTSCLIQPLSTVIHAMDRLGNIKGQSIAVVGLGAIGLLFCWLSRKYGAGEIVGIDPYKNRCQLAEEFGATRTLPMYSYEIFHYANQGSSKWKPPDICIEAVGHQMDTLNDCIVLVKKRGTVVAFGVPDHCVYAFEFDTFFRKNEQLIAAITPEWSQYLPKAKDLFYTHQIQLKSLITHQFPISEAEKAFTLYERHENRTIKVLLDATRWDRS